MVGGGYKRRGITKMNILFVTSRHPDETSNGSEIRTNNLHKALSQIGTVYTIIPIIDKNAEFVDHKNRIAKVFIYKRFSRIWLLNVLLERRLPLFSCSSISGKKICEKIWGEIKFDYTVCRYVHSATQFSPWEVAPMIIDIDDEPIECYTTIYAKKFMLFPLYLYFIKKWVNYLYGKSSGLWIANKNQLKNLPDKKSFPLLNIVKKPQVLPQLEQKNVILSVGLLTYYPNYSGIDYFLDNIWPKIHAKHSDFEYHIAGRGLSKKLHKKWSKIAGVKILGFVDDLAVAYSKALFTVAPIYAGSGTAIKVIESFLHNRCCVCSKLAARGCEDTIANKHNLLIAQNDEEFIANIETLINNSDIRNELQVELAEKFEKNYSYEIFQSQVETLFQNIQLGRS